MVCELCGYSLCYGCPGRDLYTEALERVEAQNRANEKRRKVRKTHMYADSNFHLDQQPDPVVKWVEEGFQPPGFEVEAKLVKRTRRQVTPAEKRLRKQRVDPLFSAVKYK